MQIQIANSFPTPLTPLMAERIDAVADLFPGWVNKLVIEYSRSMEDVITADVQYEYRSVCLTVHPAFFEDDDWEHTLIHEVGHALLKPLIQFGDKLIENFVGDDAMRRFLLDQYAYLEEQIVEDLAIHCGKLQNRIVTAGRLSGADETRPSDGQADLRSGRKGSQ